MSCHLLMCLHHLGYPGRKKLLAALHGEGLDGRGSGNPPSPQVQCPQLKAKEKSSEYHGEYEDNTVFSTGVEGKHHIGINRKWES